MRILFLEPPRRTWPYMNFDDNYLTKQAYLCLASAVRSWGNHQPEILDCMPLKMGWKSLKSELLRRRPDVVAVGENHAMYADEALKALQLAKEVLPQVITIAGGAHFTHLADTYLGFDNPKRSSVPPPWFTPIKTQVIDYIVKGEGERTLTELLDWLESSSLPPLELPGIVFAHKGHPHHTPPRALIEDLDSLPLPAYDLVPMDQYGTSKLLFSPGGTTVYHSRGCPHACSFCVWWTQMADRTVTKDGHEILHPRWRTKSPRKMVDELQVLAEGYGKKGFVFVDESFNLDPQWSLEFAAEMKARRLKVNWFAFLRADYIVRDHKNGVLKELVDVGLSHVSVGAERVEDQKLVDFRKGSYTASITREAFDILKTHYPQVFRQATFIVGVPDETRESMLAQLDFARELDLDYPGFHPLTPVPGTDLWDQAVEQGIIEAEDFVLFDWATPVIRSKTMTRREIEEVLIELERKYVSIPWLLRGLSSRHAYKRAMYQWFVKVSANMFVDLARYALFPKSGPIMPLVKPPWYDN